MSFTTALGAHAQPKRREKLFGNGRPRPLDRDAKVAVMNRARALMRRTEAGKAYGLLTAKTIAVLEALLWGFHNAETGLCFPSLEKVAERAACARSTVGRALKALEGASVLTWVNRIARRRVGPSASGGEESRIRVMRTSNAYTFTDPGERPSRPKSSKSENRSGTEGQESIHLLPLVSLPISALDAPLASALERLRRAMGLSDKTNAPPALQERKESVWKPQQRPKPFGNTVT